MSRRLPLSLLPFSFLLSFFLVILIFCSFSLFCLFLFLSLPLAVFLSLHFSRISPLYVSLSYILYSFRSRIHFRAIDAIEEIEEEQEPFAVRSFFP